MAIVYKNENIEKVATAEEKLDKVRNALIEKVDADNEEAVSLSEKLDDAIFDGEEEGKKETIELLRNATSDYLEFITDLSKDLKPDSSYSSLNDVYHELYQWESKERNSNPLIETFRDVGLAKNISEQEQTFMTKLDKALNNGDIKNVVAWMTMTALINEYVLEPAREIESITPDDAKEIVQDALNKLTTPNKQSSFEKPKVPIALWFYLLHKD